MVADYCFMRDVHDEVLATVLVVKLYPAKALLAVVCPSKGTDEIIIQRVAQFIKDSGYLKIACKPY